MNRVMPLKSQMLIPIVAFALLIFVGLATQTSVVQAQDNATDTSRTITVSGIGAASGAPDIAYLQIGTDQTDANPATAFNNANSVMSAVRDAVVGLGVDAADIQTSTFNMWVQDNTDSNGNPTGERTYHAQNMVTITIRDISQAGDVINAGIDAGANNVNGLTFGIADSTELANQARDLAIADAQARAAQIASTLGVEVGDVITVNESVSSDNQPRPIMAASIGGGGASVSQGQLTVNVQVTITFAIGS